MSVFGVINPVISADSDGGSPLAMGSDWVRPITGCGCPSCGRGQEGFKAVDPSNDPTIGSGTTDTVPGNTSTTAVLTPGGSVTGTVNPLADRDWYAIDLVAGQQYTFSLNGAAGAMGALGDPFLRLYNSAGTLITQNDDANGSLNSQITFVAETTGRYFLAAGAFDDTGVGSYSLSSTVGTVPPPANPLDSINWGTVRTLGAGNVINVYFAQAGEVFSTETASRSWTSYEIQQTMLAFQQFSNVINVTFQQVTTAAEASFRLVMNGGQAGSTTLGWFQVAGGSTPVTGWFDNDASSWSTAGLAQGGAGFVTLVHEFGHGLGLAHPHDDGGSSTIMQGVTSPFDSYGTGNLNQNIFTVMSYNDGWSTGPQGRTPSNNYGQMGTLAALDIASLQADYGANTTFANGNNTYTLPDTNAGGSFYSCIWDTGGTDTIQYSGTRNATIDLRAATLTQTNGGGGYVSFADTIHGGFTIANGVVIENAIGGSGNDTLTGNAAANTLTGNAGGDTLTGGGGNDTFVYSAGADVVTDFTVAGTEDVINLVGVGTFTTLAQIVALGAQVGANSVFTFSAGNTLTLNNVTLSALGVQDFLVNGAAVTVGGSNVINGTTNADSLTGTAGADQITGLAGNDTIDGRGGGDTISGGDNDDTIYYYGTDTPANITGGNGSDTLLIINGTAPTSFNLGAQGFEAARHVLNDVAGNQAWRVITENYNATWQRLTTDRVNDDNTRLVYTYDRGALTWNTITDNYNAAGGRIRQDILNDNNTYRYFFWDLAGTQTWSTFDEEYTAAGARHTQRITNDNGTLRYFYWDVAGAQTWSTFDEEYTAGNVRMIQRIINDNGTGVTQTFDHANNQTWSSITDYTNAASQRTEQRIINDNNSYVRVFYDPTNAFAWSTITDTYNTAGVLVSSVTVPG